MTPEPPFGRISPDQQAEWDREEAAAEARWEQMDPAEQIAARIAYDESELEPCGYATAECEADRADLLAEPELEEELGL